MWITKAHLISVEYEYQHWINILAVDLNEGG